MNVPSTPPCVVKGRKGRISVVDAIVAALWPTIDGSGTHLNSRSLKDIRAYCSERLGFDVPASTVRAAIYRKPEIFIKANNDDAQVLYRLRHEFLDQASKL